MITRDGDHCCCLSRPPPPPPPVSVRDTPSFVVFVRRRSVLCASDFYGQVQERSDGRRPVRFGCVFGTVGVHHEELGGHGRQTGTSEIRKDRLVSRARGHARKLGSARIFAFPFGQAAGAGFARTDRWKCENSRARDSCSAERPNLPQFFVLRNRYKFPAFSRKRSRNPARVSASSLKHNDHQWLNIRHKSISCGLVSTPYASNPFAPMFV